VVVVVEEEVVVLHSADLVQKPFGGLTRLEAVEVVEVVQMAVVWAES
jgi:hypothetical protein